MKEEVTIEGWVARQKDGVLVLYLSKPQRDDLFGCWTGNYADDINPDPFPSVTWEGEPRKVSITIKVE